jgi:hypothetical protein
VVEKLQNTKMVQKLIPLTSGYVRNLPDKGNDHKRSQFKIEGEREDYM